MDSRDVGGDRDGALEMQVWLISCVSSEHVLGLQWGTNRGWGWLITGVTQLGLCQAGSVSCLPVMLTELEMSRLIVQALLPCIFCTGTSHEVPVLGNPAVIYTQGLGMLMKTEFECWVLIKQIWGTSLGSHCSLFNLPIPVLSCGTPVQEEQQNCARRTERKSVSVSCAS